jgi:hypothetical protein
MRMVHVLVASGLLPACAGSPPLPPAAAVESGSRASHAAQREGGVAPVASTQRGKPAPADATAENHVAEADGIVRDSLALPGRDDRFSVERQVSELERAIELYRQFIERAGDDPRFGDAVQRSRARIADAEQTIVFLRQQTAAR